MKHVRRLTAMTLVLAFVFLLSTSAFAVSAEGGPYGNLNVTIELTGGSRTATASMRFTENDLPNADEARSYEGTLTITYTYCPENQVRPSSYITKTVTKSFSSGENGNVFMLQTDAIPSGYMMIEATCQYRATIYLQNATVYYTPADLTEYLY